MEAVDMCRRFLVVIFVVFCIYLAPLHSVNIDDHVVNFVSHAHEVQNAIDLIQDTRYVHRKKRDLSQNDERCRKREDTFLTKIKTGTRIETRYTFANKTHFSLAMAWASDKDDGTLIVVSSEIVAMMFATSNVWRSQDYGRTWTNIDEKIDNGIIRHDEGVIRNPHDASTVYLISYHDYLYVTEDGGETFNKRSAVGSDEVISGGLVFHSDNYQKKVLAISRGRKLYATENNFQDKYELAEEVVLAKWSSKDLNEKDAIYAMIGRSTDRNPFIARVRTYTLVKFASMKSHHSTRLLGNVIAFGIQGKFLYASIYKSDNPTQDTPKLMIVSTDGGHTWNEAQLPTLAGDRFYSVLDMSEKLIFMHVDNPGDTGTGTLYTSATAGVVYSESLQHHLYPNYGSVTDFYKVESMRGVYLASQLNDDKSIHTMITFDRGGVWQPIIPPQEYCKDKTKEGIFLGILCA